MLESSISAARATGARILLPGTIYNYGPDVGLPPRPCRNHGTTRPTGINTGNLRDIPLRRSLGRGRHPDDPSHRAASGNPNIPVRSFPWPLVTLLSPFVALFHEMREMRYLWRQPLRLNNDRLLSTLTTEPQTPLEQAVRMTLTGLGCLKRV
jgi:hypothetical protein